MRFIENHLRSLPATIGKEIFILGSQISKQLFLFFFSFLYVHFIFIKIRKIPPKYIVKNVSQEIWTLVVC